MHIHKHIIDRAKFTELNEIYWAMSLKTFAVSFITIFIPIYLFKLGYSPFSIFFFYAAFNFFIPLLNEIAARIITKIGPKHTMILSFPALMIFLGMLLTLPIYKWNLLLLAFIWSIETGLFWMSYHVDFSKAKHKKTCTSELSKIEILCSIFGAVTPFVGGVIASMYGISFTLVLSIFFLVFAALPLLKTSEPYVRQTIDMKKIQVKKILRDLLSYAGLGMDFAAMMVIWPLFVFLIVKSYQAVGAIESFALILMIVITFMVGKYADRTDKQKLIKRGGIVSGFVWMGKALSQSISQVIFFNLINAVTFPFLKLPFAAEFYIHADEEARIEYILWMERAVDYGRMFFFLILAALSFYFEIKFVLIAGLLLAIPGSLLTGLMRPVTKEVCDANHQ